MGKELDHPDLEYDYDEQHIPHPYETLADGRSRRDEMMNFVCNIIKFIMIRLL